MQSALYQHPQDLQSLMNLRAMKWIEKVSKVLVAEDLEADFYLLNLSDNVKVTRAAFPDIIASVERACSVLGVEQVPRVFIDTNPEAHALCIGEREPMMVISSGMLELFDAEELDAAIAHEVGHLACGHAYYRLLAENFGGISQLSNVVPGLGIASFAIKIPLYDWYRKADFSADRAAFLVARSVSPVVRMIGKIAGGTRKVAAKVTTEDLLAQAREIESITTEMKTGTMRRKAAYLFSNIVMQGMLRTQPWPAVRLSQLLQWERSPRAMALLRGETPPPEEVLPVTTEKEGPGFAQRFSDQLASVGKSMKSWRTGESEAPEEPTTTEEEP